MREWRKTLEIETFERTGRHANYTGHGTDAPLYYEREVDCDGVGEFPSQLADGGRWNASGFARRNVAARRVPGAFGPGPGSLPG